MREDRLARDADRDPGIDLDACDWIALWQAARRIALRLGAKNADAEDIAQETVMRLLVAPPSGDKLQAWTRQVVHNLLYDLRERDHARVRAHSQVGRRTREPASPSGEYRVVIDADRILSRMPDRPRTLLGFYLLGYTHREIASLLRCEVHQVGPRLHRAIETARRSLSRRVQIPRE